MSENPPKLVEPVDAVETEEIPIEEYDDPEDESEEEEEEEEEEIEEEEEAEDEKHEVDEPISKEPCLYDHILDESDKSEEDNDIIETETKINEPTLLDVNDRISNPVMTDYECTRIIGTRTKQLDLGSRKFVKANALSNYDIAVMELKNNMIPFKIKRPLPNGRYEIWSISELDKSSLKCLSDLKQTFE